MCVSLSAFSFLPLTLNFSLYLGPWSPLSYLNILPKATLLNQKSDHFSPLFKQLSNFPCHLLFLLWDKRPSMICPHASHPHLFGHWSRNCSSNPFNIHPPGVSIPRQLSIHSSPLLVLYLNFTFSIRSH